MRNSQRLFWTLRFFINFLNLLSVFLYESFWCVVGCRRGKDENFCISVIGAVAVGLL